MNIQEIKNTDYRVWYDEATKTVICEGSLRLSGMEEYAPIVKLFNEAMEKDSDKITLNLSRLEFLNSSGISMLSKFVINVRQKGNVVMMIKGSQEITWQGKSLKNLLKLMPSLQLELE